MGKIVVAPELVRQVGVRFVAESDHLREIVHEALRAIDSLDTDAWTAAERAELGPLVGRLRAEGEARVAAWERLGRRLEQVAEAFKQADGDAVLKLMGLPLRAGRPPGLATPVPPGDVPEWVEEVFTEMYGRGAEEGDLAQFRQWREAFKAEHQGVMPTRENYAEFLESYEYSGHGKVEWTDDDWVAFYYAKEVGLDAWIERGVTFEGDWSGEALLCTVVALNMSEVALGDKTDAALGLADGLTIVSGLTPNPAESSGHAFSGNPDKFGVDMASGDYAGMFRTVIHETGHLIGENWNVASKGSPVDRYNEYWGIEGIGWRRAGPGGEMTYTDREPGGTSIVRSINSPDCPEEDFADVFLWYVYYMNGATPRTPKHEPSGATFPFGVPGLPYEAHPVTFPTVVHYTEAGDSVGPVTEFFSTPDLKRRLLLKEMLAVFAPSTEE